MDPHRGCYRLPGLLGGAASGRRRLWRGLHRHSFDGSVRVGVDGHLAAQHCQPDREALYLPLRWRQRGTDPQARLFPTDVEGQLLLAQIEAEDLKDLPAAELTLERFCAQPGHAQQNIVFALYSLADWHLKITQDREAARRNLQKVIELFPESESALGAAHRIAHLSSPEMLLASQADRKFTVTEGVKSLGLLRDQNHLKPVELDPAQVAADYVKHLEQHPLDTEAREKLAIIYADHYERLDMAADELEQMITQPNQPGRLVVHWLNLLADLQIRHGAGHETVRQTLQRIVDRAPDAAAAGLARNRLALLKLEMKSKGKSQAVKLGSYEQNIGLKMGLPPR